MSLVCDHIQHLAMTKNELLNSLATIDTEDAGAVTAIVEGLADSDERFLRSFPGPIAAIGYWLRQPERVAAGMC